MEFPLENFPNRPESDPQRPSLSNTPEAVQNFAPPPPPPAPDQRIHSPETSWTPPPAPPAGPGGALTQDEKLWGTFMHLSALIVGIIGSMTGIPAFSFLGPLVLWLIKRHESPFLDDQGKEALNFNITVGLAMLLCFPLILLLGLGLLLMFIIGIAALVLTIMAAIKANNGEWYRYPFSLRLVK